MAVGRISPSRETPDFTREQMERYRRQMVIPEVGEAGRSKLRDARLCAVDRDRVELGNLNRQVTHWTQDLGEAKAESARRKPGALNPEVHLEMLRADVTDAAISGLATGCSVLVEAADNLQTRKAINRFSVREGIPFAVGGVNGFHGMVTTVIPGASACLECIFPGRHPGGEEEIGVLGPLPGMVASIQALEAIKLTASQKPAQPPLGTLKPLETTRADNQVPGFLRVHQSCYAAPAGRWPGGCC